MHNGVAYVQGLYSFVEQVDLQFLERNGYDPEVKNPSTPLLERRQSALRRT